MRKFIVLIFFLIIISIMLFSNFKHEKKIMIIGYIKNPTTIEYSKEINDEDVIEKFKKILMILFWMMIRLCQWSIRPIFY